jgi:hypothetical protein
MLHTAPPAPFQDVEKPHDVGLHVDEGIHQRVTHPRLRRQMSHPIRTLRFKEPEQIFLVGDVHPEETERLMGLQAPQPRLLESDVVIIAQVVDPHHLLPPLEQPKGKRRTDKTRRAGDERLHAFLRKTR